MFAKHTWSAFAWSLLISCLYFIPNNQLPKFSFTFFDNFFLIIAFAVLYFLLAKGFKKQRQIVYFKKNHKKTALYISVIFGLVLEILQDLFVHYRGFELYDILAILAGILVGWVVFLLIFGRIKT